MKKTNKIFAIILLSIALIIVSITSVSAKDENAVDLWPTTGLDGAKKLSATVDKINETSTEITFRVNLPQGAKMATLRGDVDQNGRVEVSDAVYLNKILVGADKFPSETSRIAAEAFIDGKTDSKDSSAILSKIAYLDSAIEVKGTLASKVTKSEFVRNSTNDGTYLVKITLPKSSSGTIGFKLNEGFLKYDYLSTNANIEKVVSFPSKPSVKPAPSNPSTPSSKPTATPSSDKNANMSIDDGQRDGNKITFKIIAPTGTGLVGDANNDGKVSKEDSELILSYLASLVKKDGINLILADADNNSENNVADAVLLNKDYVGKLNNFISLTGTLAEKSTFELVRASDGTYSVVVTIPEDTKSGTIGVAVKANVFKAKDYLVNKDMKSSLFSINENSDNNSGNNSDNNGDNNSSDNSGNGSIDDNSDGKDDDSNGNSSNSKGLINNNDSSTAKSVIPQTGVKFTAFTTLALAILSAVVSVIKQRKINKRLYLR